VLYENPVSTVVLVRRGYAALASPTAVPGLLKKASQLCLMDGSQTGPHIKSYSGLYILKLRGRHRSNG